MFVSSVSSYLSFRLALWEVSYWEHWIIKPLCHMCPCVSTSVPYYNVDFVSFVHDTLPLVYGEISVLLWTFSQPTNGYLPVPTSVFDFLQFFFCIAEGLFFIQDNRTIRSIMFLIRVFLCKLQNISIRAWVILKWLKSVFVF